MATQKDYKAIAQIIKNEYTTFDDTNENDFEGQDATRHIAVNIAYYFAQNNEWFNRDTFIIACGLSD